jgi:hypothetical protein
MENLFHDDKTAFPVCQHIFFFFFRKDEIGGQRGSWLPFYPYFISERTRNKNLNHQAAKGGSAPRRTTARQHKGQRLEKKILGKAGNSLDGAPWSRGMLALLLGETPHYKPSGLREKVDSLLQFVFSITPPQADIPYRHFPLTKPHITIPQNPLAPLRGVYHKQPDPAPAGGLKT